MKQKIVIAFIILVGFNSLQAQDSTSRRIKEIYLSLANISPLNVQIKYKQQMGVKSFLKIGLVDLSFNTSLNHLNSKYIKSSNSNYSGGLEVGLEFRKKLFSRFAFYHGPNLGFTYSAAHTKNTDYSGRTFSSFNSNYYFTIPYTFGFLFNMTTHFYLSAEINPAFYYSVNGIGNQEQMGLGLNNRYGLMSLVYRL